MLWTAKTLARGLLLAFGLAALPQEASAQGQPYVHDRPRYTLTMTSGWDSVAVPPGQGAGLDLSVIAKNAGINGLAYISCAVGSTAPNLDSLAANYGSVLGGNITKDSSGTLTLGKYTVAWQDFKYDSLPILSAMIQARAPFIPRLENGKFRAYYLVSNGYVFIIAGIRVVAVGPYPYADIEQGISTLELKPLSGKVRGAIRDLGGGLWTRDGVLGGDWLRKHPAHSVECFGLDGAYLGSARPDGDAAWVLPANPPGMVVVIRARDGRSLSRLVRP